MVKYNKDQLNQIFHALSDKTRRNMVERLTRGSLVATALAREYSISFPAVSKHLRVLEKASLVKLTRQGRVRLYSINSRQLEKARKWIEFWSKFWNKRLDNLEKFLKNN